MNTVFTVVEDILATSVFWGIFAVIAFAVALSGKASTTASSVLIWIAFALTVFAITRAEFIFRLDLLLKSLTLGCLCCGLAAGAVILQRWLLSPKPITGVMSSSPSGSTPPESSTLSYVGGQQQIVANTVKKIPTNKHKRRIVWNLVRAYREEHHRNPTVEEINSALKSQGQGFTVTSIQFIPGRVPPATRPIDSYIAPTIILSGSNARLNHIETKNGPIVIEPGADNVRMNNVTADNGEWDRLVARANAARPATLEDIQTQLDHLQSCDKADCVRKISGLRSLKDRLSHETNPQNVMALVDEFARLKAEQP